MSDSAALSTSTVAGVQAAYYAATGLFPFASRRAFEAVTGPKPEWWLVLTVGGLTSVVAATLGQAARHRRVTDEVALLGAGSAVALGAIDVVYGGPKRRISPVYLVDGIGQAAIVGLWWAARRAGRGGETTV